MAGHEKIIKIEAAVGFDNCLPGALCHRIPQNERHTLGKVLAIPCRCDPDNGNSPRPLIEIDLHTLCCSERFVEKNRGISFSVPLRVDADFSWRHARDPD